MNTSCLSFINISTNCMYHNLFSIRFFISTDKKSDHLMIYLYKNSWSLIRNVCNENQIYINQSHSFIKFVLIVVSRCTTVQKIQSWLITYIDINWNEKTGFLGIFIFFLKSIGQYNFKITYTVRLKRNDLSAMYILWIRASMLYDLSRTVNEHLVVATKVF